MIWVHCPIIFHRCVVSGTVYSKRLSKYSMKCTVCRFISLGDVSVWQSARCCLGEWLGRNADLPPAVPQHHHDCVWRIHLHGRQDHSRKSTDFYACKYPCSGDSLLGHNTVYCCRRLSTFRYVSVLSRVNKGKTIKRKGRQMGMKLRITRGYFKGNYFGIP